MLDEILSPRRVFLDLQSAPKGDLLREMTRRLADLGEIDDAGAVADALIKREEMMTTGVKRGFAFPHAFTPHARALALTLGVIRAGTDYQSLDGFPVEFIFLLLGPPTGQDVHLRLLARISRTASEPGMLEALREAQDAESVINILSEADRFAANALY